MGEQAEPFQGEAAGAKFLDHRKHHDSRQMHKNWITDMGSKSKVSSGVFTNCRHFHDKSELKIVQFLTRSLGIAGFRPSVTEKAWGKTGACAAGGASAVLFFCVSIQTAVACLSTGRTTGAFRIHRNCYNFGRRPGSYSFHLSAFAVLNAVRGNGERQPRWPNVSD